MQYMNWLHFVYFDYSILTYHISSLFRYSYGCLIAINAKNQEYFNRVLYRVYNSVFYDEFASA